MSDEIDFDTLAKEALENARKDRELVKESFENMKDALRIDTSEDVQKTMLVGEKAVKLLDLLNKTNAQIVQIAQLSQKKPKKVEEDDDEEFSFSTRDLAELKQKMNEESEEELKVRVEERPPTKKKKSKEA